MDPIIVEYVNIDDHNRPVFKEIGRSKYYGSIDTLFPYGESESEVKKKITSFNLGYFGSRFNCEPYGDPVDNIEIKWRV